MATLNQNITQAIDDFDSVRTAIQDKGVSVPSGTPTASYSELVEEIDGSSLETDVRWVEFPFTLAKTFTWSEGEIKIGATSSTFVVTNNNPYWCRVIKGNNVLHINPNSFENAGAIVSGEKIQISVLNNAEDKVLFMIILDYHNDFDPKQIEIVAFEP